MPVITIRRAAAEVTIYAADGQTVTLKLMTGGDGAPAVALAICDDDGALAVAELDPDAAAVLAAELRTWPLASGQR